MVVAQGVHRIHKTCRRTIERRSLLEKTNAGTLRLEDGHLNQSGKAQSQSSRQCAEELCQEVKEC